MIVFKHAAFQSCSVRRIPVVIVFTFMDCFKTKDQREEFKKKTLNWISYHNIKVTPSHSVLALADIMALQTCTESDTLVRQLPSSSDIHVCVFPNSVCHLICPHPYR
jgi:hypothetical protein